MPTEEDLGVKTSASKTSKVDMRWSQAMQDLKKDFENQVGEVEEKLGREM